MAADDHAIVVGINTYPGLKPLHGPERDAIEFYNWVTALDGGDVPVHQAKLVRTSQYHPPDPRDEYDAKPALDDVNRHFSSLVALGDRTSGYVGERLYVFLGGHGFSSDDLVDSALYTANAHPTYNLVHVPATRYVRSFQRAALFKEIVLVMDCCRDFATAAILGPLPWKARDLKESAADTRLFMAMAAQVGSKARERVINGAVRGLFSYAFMEALARAPLVGSDVLGSAVKGYVLQRMRELVGNDGQRPEIHVPDGDIVLARRPACAGGVPATGTTTPVTIELGSWALPDEPVEVIDAGENVIPLNARARRVDARLGAGIYILRVARVARVRPFTVVKEPVYVRVD